MDGAKRLGEKLVAEVEVEGLSSLLTSLRAALNQTTSKDYFNIPSLDALITHQTPHQPTQQPAAPAAPGHRFNELWDPELPHPPAQASVTHHSSKEQSKNTQCPVVELISPPPTHHPSGSGKTSLIYLITTLAILPSTISSTQIGGQNAAVVIFDPLSHFSVARLAEVMAVYIQQKLDSSDPTSASQSAPVSADKAPNHPKPTNPNLLNPEIKATIIQSLQHVHIFRPQSWDSTLATLASLPDYLFDRSAHVSMRRRLHSVVLEDVDAYYWNIRASSSSSTAGFSTTNSIPASGPASLPAQNPPAPPNTNANPISTASHHLTTTLLTLSTKFSACIITTSHSPSPAPPSYRAPLPPTWPLATPLTRLAVRRVEVIRFAPGMSAEEAGVESSKERGARWEAVCRGRFECWKLGGGGIGAGGGQREGGRERGGGEGFVFRVGLGRGQGVRIEDEDEEKGREGG